MPNMTSTPRASSDRTSDCAPLTGSGAAGRLAAGAAFAVGRVPAATVSGLGPWPVAASVRPCGLAAGVSGLSGLSALSDLWAGFVMAFRPRALESDHGHWVTRPLT